MSWQEIIATLVVLAGLGAGAFLVAQRPAFWIEFGTRLARQFLPLAMAYVLKRNPPEIEKAMQDCYRRGGRWDNTKKRCVEPR